MRSIPLIADELDGAPGSIQALARRYPRAVAAFAAMGALDHLERIARLDATWADIRQGRALDASGVEYALGPLPGPGAPHDPAPTYDLIYAGGGLGLLHAAIMAQRYGRRVLLFDRGEVGCAHREWNISRAELAALVDVGLCDWDELRDVIMNEYDHGVVRFYAHPRASAAELRLRDVLNVALDAGALLRLARRKLEAAGGTVLDRRTFRRILVSESGPVQALVEVARDDGAVERYAGRLLLDGMGSASPLALRRFGGRPFAAVCPTVGTVAEGFAAGDAPGEHNPRAGDILVSVADMQRGQQYMWEGFPGRGDELTVYLFYYDTLREARGAAPRAGLLGGAMLLQNLLPWGMGRLRRPIPQGEKELGEATPPQTPPRTRCGRFGGAAPRQESSFLVDPQAERGGAAQPPPDLMQLFEDYFALLPTYKRPGPRFRHLKPVYGYIPARHSLRRQETPLLRGVLPIGDSAAQQSPLTFCGFGSHVRNLDRTTALLDHALRADLLEPQRLGEISAYQANVSLNWVFSRFMQPWDAPGDVNALQNVFLRVLGDLGADLSERFFRDQMRWSDYHRMVLGMFRRYPRIVLIAWRVLGPGGVRRWIADYLAYCRAALAAWCGRRMGARVRAALLAALDRVAPALGLRLRARIAEWRAMGWDRPPCTPPGPML